MAHIKPRQRVAPDQRVIEGSSDRFGHIGRRETDLADMQLATSATTGHQPVARLGPEKADRMVSTDRRAPNRAIGTVNAAWHINRDNRPAAVIDRPNQCRSIAVQITIETGPEQRIDIISRGNRVLRISQRHIITPEGHRLLTITGGRQCGQTTDAHRPANLPQHRGNHETIGAIIARPTEDMQRTTGQGLEDIAGHDTRSIAHQLPAVATGRNIGTVSRLGLGRRQQPILIGKIHTDQISQMKTVNEAGKMGRLTGIEPATARITTECSTAELQSP